MTGHGVLWLWHPWLIAAELGFPANLFRLIFASSIADDGFAGANFLSTSVNPKMRNFSFGGSSGWQSATAGGEC